MHDKKIKILHTIRQGDFGGGETYLYNLVTHLNQFQFEPVVLSFTEGALLEKLQQEGIKTYVIPTLKPFNIFVYGQVLHILKQEKIDILHMHGTRAATNTIVPALLCKTKIIYTVHGWSFHTGNSSVVTRLRKLSEQFLTRTADQTICGSKADIIEGQKHSPKATYKLIPNSIDTHLFNPDSAKNDLKKELGFTEKDIIISFIARITSQKDPFTFIQSIPAVCTQIPHAKFLMVGDGELKQACIQLAASLGIEHKIVFLPFRKDIKELLQLTDIFVLPSLWEVIPLGLLEAMSMEKSCIATSIPGTTEALIDGETGLLIELNSPVSLANKIMYLASNPAVRQKLGKAARQQVQARFDIQALVKANEEMYVKLSGVAKEARLLAPDLPLSSDYPFITG